MLNRKIKVCGKEYVLPKLDFNAMCELEELGFDITKAGSKTMSTIRSLLAFVMKCTPEEAAKAIEQEVKENHSFVAISETLFGMINDSDFFQNLAQTPTTAEN